MIKRLNENVDLQKLEQRIDDVINDVKALYESSGRLNDAFVQNKSDGSYAYEKVILKLLQCTSMLSPIWYRIHYCLKKTFPDYRMPKIAESKSRNRKRSIKESYEGSHTFGYIEPDEEFYQDIFGEFTVEEYYDEENDEILGWTWYCSDDFEPTEPYFSTAKEAYEDAKYVLTPDDGSELVIDESRSRTRKRSSCMSEKLVHMSESLEDEDTVYKYYLLRRDKGSNSYVIEDLYDDSCSLRTVKKDARDYYESDRRHLYGNTPEYWAYDVKLNKAYPPAGFTKEDQVFDYTLPIVRP